MNYLLQLSLANFGEPLFYALGCIRVQGEGPESPEAPVLGPPDCRALGSSLPSSSRRAGLNGPRRCSDSRLRSPFLLLLLLMLAGKVLRSGPDNHHDRSHYSQPEIQQYGHRDPAPEGIVEEPYRKVNRGVQQDHHQEAPPGTVVHPGEEDAHSEDRDHKTSVDEGSAARCSGQPQR